MTRLKEHSIPAVPSYSRITLAMAITCLLLSGCSGKTGSSSENPPPRQTHTASLQAQSPPPVTAASPVHAGSEGSGPVDVIEQEIASMPLEDKIGQMLLVGIDGTEVSTQTQTMITNDKVGGIILYADNIKSLKGLVSLTNELKRINTGNPVPLFVSVDQEGGKVSRLPDEYAKIPANGSVGASGSAEAAEMMGKLLAREVQTAGFNMNFAPVLDINSNPDNPVIGDRSFGNTSAKVIQLGIAEMKGIESEGIIPVVKHFPGHGDTSVDSHLELPVVNKTEAQLAKLEWRPFHAAVKEQADAAMVAHILYPNLDPDRPASLSKVIISQLLRGQMGFKGVIVTDDLTMGAIMKNYTLAAAAVNTVLAGSDILLVAHEYGNEQIARNALLAAVKQGKISEARIDESVYRILSLKDKYQLKDTPVGVPDLTQLNKDIKAWRSSFAK
ncbi:beta-N-acetylhexosaminidase [Paenibacillus sp. P46E]|uniref:beta-N-acetylhexosaminidase n=1 Tax=Paenibacillus sp. P46E TaxID=1349436 RepID=UPI00093F7BCD|nr:beta-N-acetylhexosaminidase [Paenibacillus sp. P46E]OKP94870.1 glycoside hydrolase family 3 [Paenibacillus sp. P46E]